MAMVALVSGHRFALLQGPDMRAPLTSSRDVGGDGAAA